MPAAVPSKSRDILPALISMMVWSTVYDPKTEAPASFAKAYLSDPGAMIAQYEAEIDSVDAGIFAKA